MFVKHKLKAKYYIRYVDDFILLNESRTILYEWKDEISEFLQKNLELQLHPNRQIIRPVSNGVNFLGYIVRPTHLLVRKRTLERCKFSIKQQIDEITKVTNNRLFLLFPPEKYEKLYSTIQSYFSIFAKASCHRLVHSIYYKSLPLQLLFKYNNFNITKKWVLPFSPQNLYTQYRFFRSQFRGRIVIQIASYLEMFDDDAFWASEQLPINRIIPRKHFFARCKTHIDNMERLLSSLLELQNRQILLILQSEKTHKYIMQRVAVRLYI
jgi:hypothetical protein